MFKFMKKKDKGTAKSIPKTSQIAVEELLEDGYKCQEIAEQLGTSESTVYRIKQNYQRRLERARGNTEASPESDELKKIQIEIKRKELELKQQEIEWKYADRKMERIMQLRELNGGEMPDESDGIMGQILASVLPQLLAGNNNPTKSEGVITPTPAASGVVNPAQTSLATHTTPEGAPSPSDDDATFKEYFSWMIDDVKAGKVEESEFIAALGGVGVPSGHAKKMYAKVRA